jgi:hypothetical protein
MTAPRIVVKPEEPSRALPNPDPLAAWYLLGGVGFVFAVVAGADLALAWYPLAFGDAEWEFGTVTTVFNGLPLLAVGLGLLFAGGVARGRVWVVRIASGLLLAVALVILAALALYASTLSTALSTVDPGLKGGLIKGIVRTGLQGLLYPVAFIWMGLRGFKAAA